MAKRRGMPRADVRLLQRRLGLVVDGDFGPKTEAAVRELQERAGLEVTGIVNHATWREVLK